MSARAQSGLIKSTAVRRQDHALLQRLVKSFQATAQPGHLHLLTDRLVAGGFEDVRVDISLTPRNQWDIAVQYSYGPSERSALNGRRGSHSAASRRA